MKLVCIFLMLFSASYANNPFSISVSNHPDLSNEDYIAIQKQLPMIDIADLLHQHYDHLSGYTTFEDFYGRCTKGARQILIDPSQNLYPEKVFKKLGNGGEKNCVVCSVPFGGKYPFYVKSLEKQLEEIGYNGYLLYYIGGWPNPTGEEIKFVGVPYSFKIFAMYEAYLLGCSNVLWLDSACYPLRDVNSLFDIIEKKGALLNKFLVPSDSWRFILPATRNELYFLTGTDVLDKKCYYINTIVFGMKMDTLQGQKLVREYYQLAEKGTPFLSCYPEEWVITAIMGQPEFHDMRHQNYPGLIKGSVTRSEDSPEEYEKVRREGIYFYHRLGR